MTQSLFECLDYKLYLNDVLSPKGANRGKRTQLAEKIRCRTAFISKVLKGASHFSLEHGMVINDFLSHTEEEAQFFMLLLQKARAGSQALEVYFEKQLDHVLRRRRLIQTRIAAKKSLTEETQMTYYSSWHYAAIHVLISIPRYQDKAELAKHLGLPIQKVSEYLEFLVRSGIARYEKDRYSYAEARVHLGKASPLLSKHHFNWRLRAMNSLDLQSPGDLHYSSVISFSQKDRAKIEALLLETIDKTEKIMRPSKEELAYGLTIDFFGV